MRVFTRSAAALGVAAALTLAGGAAALADPLEPSATDFTVEVTGCSNDGSVDIASVAILYQLNVPYETEDGIVLNTYAGLEGAEPGEFDLIDTRPFPPLEVQTIITTWEVPAGEPFGIVAQASFEGAGFPLGSSDLFTATCPEPTPEPTQNAVAPAKTDATGAGGSSPLVGGLGVLAAAGAAAVAWTVRAKARARG